MEARTRDLANDGGKRDVLSRTPAPETMPTLRSTLAALALIAAPTLSAQTSLVQKSPSTLAPSKVATTYTIDQFLSPASPLEVSAARKADKLAWVTYERGIRNIYVASAP